MCNENISEGIRIREQLTAIQRLSQLLLSLCRVCLFVTPWTVTCRAPLSIEFSRQEYWSGLPFLPPGDLPYQGLNLCLLHCRLILYLLINQGSPKDFVYKLNEDYVAIIIYLNVFFKQPQPYEVILYFNYLIYYIFHLHIKLLIYWFIGFLENCHLLVSLLL